MCSRKRPFPDQVAAPKRSAWQQPASCDFCRLKKIRCDKQRPCSSCVSRDTICEYASVPPGTPQPTLQTARYESAQATHIGSILVEEDIQEMKYRLKRIEQLLRGRPGPPKFSDPSGLYSLAVTPLSESKATIPNIVDRDWDNLESIAASPQCENIENASPANTSLLSPAATTTAYPTNASRVNCRTPDSVANGQLPTLGTARALLEHYIQGVDCLGRVVHGPSTRNLLESVYSQLSQSIKPPDERVIFLQSIFASASFYLESEHVHHSSDDLALLTGQSHIWKEIALHHMLHIDQVFSSSLISLQSALIILFLLWDSEGQSKRYHTLKSLAYAKAIQVGIHNIDAESSTVGPDSLEREMKRRLWWHLTCTDWLLGSAPGPQHGIYMINPRHTTVRVPANIEDEGLTQEGPCADPKPDYHPTSMSFFLYRLKFAQLCRESMDAMDHAKTMSPSPKAIYQLILDISDRYMSFLNELPWFFRLHGDEEKCAELAEKQPYISHQRAALLYGIYSRLGRLHRPFISKGITDPSFHASYKIGIECAEKLLQIRRMTVHQGRLDIFGRSQSVDQHTFNAMLLLTIEVMAHPKLPDSERRRADVIEICRLLQDKHTRLAQPSNNGIIRAVQLLLDIVRNPNTPLLKDRGDNTALVLSNSAQTKDGCMPPDLCTGLTSGEPTAETSHEMAWIDECLSGTHGQSINVVFDELRGSLSETSNLSWEGFFNWEGLS
ncbi:hypothetical protein ASPCAL14325 [Aspergillus calidoustus]|uniref:Zn(2)-C6 fungal-type domain-containing protein n=1 Tax=Aspergillus calidoustus TaxID=454130 RepID=A0A0U5GH90_ASPCI|nr:hypothetical protein ASPCAL14325 [Aspergillus calidoustus]